MMGEFPVQADIVFNAKPDAIPYNYRISYKVSQLCLIFAHMRVGKFLFFNKSPYDILCFIVKREHG